MEFAETLLKDETITLERAQTEIAAEVAKTNKPVPAAKPVATAAPAADGNRTASEILFACRAANLNLEFAENLINQDGITVESARAAGPNHVVNFAKNLEDIYALGDNNRIHQVVANLLANARTHTPAGTVIDVTVKQDTDGVRIRIADNGPGLSKDDQERIFERFFRADASRVRTDGEGTGLGLSIVDAVMRAHAGQVSVESELGKGAAFTLFFPLES